MGVEAILEISPAARPLRPWSGLKTAVVDVLQEIVNVPSNVFESLVALAAIGS